mmetsp:Transcript_40051/g.105896  ORF Transcript_40051/g.105896 Transcript_40051/m.105896 type:complete len:320 (+) Transcript_40051:303-1262(+)
MLHDSKASLAQLSVVAAPCLHQPPRAQKSLPSLVDERPLVLGRLGATDQVGRRPSHRLAHQLVDLARLRERVRAHTALNTEVCRQANVDGSEPLVSEAMREHNRGTRGDWRSISGDAVVHALRIDDPGAVIVRRSVLHPDLLLGDQLRRDRRAVCARGGEVAGLFERVELQVELLPVKDRFSCRNAIIADECNDVPCYRGSRRTSEDPKLVLFVTANQLLAKADGECTIVHGRLEHDGVTEPQHAVFGSRAQFCGSKLRTKRLLLFHQRQLAVALGFYIVHHTLLVYLIILTPIAEPNAGAVAMAAGELLRSVQVADRR